jgi:hypothetical protein
VLDAFPDEWGRGSRVERGFSLSQARVDRVVAGLEQLGDLVDAEQGIGIEDEYEEEFTGGETAVCERRVPSICEAVAAVATPDSGTVVPSLEGCFTGRV